MLNLWPDLLAYSFFAPLLLRLAVGISTFYFGILTFRAWVNGSKALGVLWIIVSLMLIIGLWTQAVVLGLLALLLLKFIGVGTAVKWPWYYDLLLTGALLSLLLTGAGALAFDLPL